MLLEAVQTIVGERYTIVRMLGAGGLGRVFEARDNLLHRQVALKTVAPGSSASVGQRMVREARAMARIRSPHVVALHDCITSDDGLPVLVMELIRGVSLASHMHEDEPLEVPLAMAIARQMAIGLVALHHHGLVHRDIKPGNILLDSDLGRVVLSDLGLVQLSERRAAEADDTSAHQEAKPPAHAVVGTPLYISPEAVRGAVVDERADLYSMGVVCYQLLTGKLPLEGTDLRQLLDAHVTGDIRPLRELESTIPAAVEAVVLRLLERDPEARYPGAQALLEALDALGGESQASGASTRLADWLRAREATDPSRSRDPRKRRHTDTPLRVRTLATMTDDGLEGAFDKTQPLPELFAETMQPDEIAEPGTSEPGLQGGARLVIVSSAEQRDVPLGDGVLVGRAPSCDIVLHEPSASRQHFTIRLLDWQYFIEDLGSRNGIQVNGSRVTRARLTDGDRIAIGTTRMVFVQPLSGAHEIAARHRLDALDELWRMRWANAAEGEPANIDHFVRELSNGLLRQALGFRVEHIIPSYRGITGYMVEAHMLWIRQARFPILFVPVTEALTLDDVVHQLMASGAAEFLALLIAIPPPYERGDAAAELSRLVADSVFRYDLAVMGYEDLRRIVRINDSKTLVETLLDKGIELSRLSPYVVRGPVPPNMFFGRESEIKQLSQSVRNHAVVGGRRMGKSSMFLRVARLLGGDPRFVPYYVNCEACFDNDDFLATMEDVVQPQEPFASIVAMRRELTRMARSIPDQTMVFLLDEIDELLAPNGTSDAAGAGSGRLFKTLRVLSHEGVAHFIFSGGRTLHHALHDAHSPFFNFCDVLELYPLNKLSVDEIITQPMRQLSIVLDREQAILERIFTVTSGHPNLVQYICHQLVTGDFERRITLARVDEVIESQEFVEHFVETAWSQATPLERLMTLLPRAETCSRDWLFDRLRELGVYDRRAVESALSTLELYALMRQEGGELRFVLSYFPEAAKRLDLPRQVAAQLAELEDR